MLRIGRLTIKITEFRNNLIEGIIVFVAVYGLCELFELILKIVFG